MKNANAKRVMQGALVLSIASIIAKILSAVYRIPLQNLVGNTGFYVYQQIYPIYGIGMTFALNGFPIFISKIVAEEPDEKRKLMISRYSILILAGLSVVTFGILMIGAQEIAILMGDIQLTPLLRAVSTMFLFMPLLATGRGYFQGIYDVVPTAKSQVAEQIVRVTIIILVAILSVRSGWSAYKMGTWAMASSTFAAVAASLFFIKFGLKVVNQKKIKFDVKLFKRLCRRFIIEGGLICLLASMILLLQLVDSFSVKNSLVLGGATQEVAKSLKGIYDRAQPLVQLGTVIATAFATTLLPALTEAIQRRDTKAFYKSATSLLRISLTISMTASVGMIALMPHINKLLFGSFDGSGTLAVYNLSIIFAALIFVYNSVLQSIGDVRVTLSAIITGVFFKILLNGWAVQTMGIFGASLITVISLALIASLMSRALPGRLSQRVYHEQHFLMKLIIGNILMWLAVTLAVGFVQMIFNFQNRWGSILLVIIGIVIGGLVFISYIFRFKLFSIREWLTVPYGTKILRIIQRITK
ncbi:polysaccharide biosynthesis protein [Pediococcus stilesii]|uniref:Polysaccharide transporter n=1 Tax=Pediococcus stilesii TaxID=331679 RepID=A0A0R2KUK1_9LACO|nr:polysaccharide transporter [Pediococcus stilesii]